MLLLEYLLRRRDVRPSILFELHEPLEGGQIFPLRLVVHDVGYILLLDLLARRSSMNSDGRDTYGPGRVADRHQNVRVVRLHELAGVAVRDHLQQGPLDGRFQALALAEPARSI